MGHSVCFSISVSTLLFLLSSHFFLLNSSAISSSTCSLSQVLISPKHESHLFCLSHFYHRWLSSLHSSSTMPLFICIVNYVQLFDLQVVSLPLPIIISCSWPFRHNQVWVYIHQPTIIFLHLVTFYQFLSSMKHLWWEIVVFILKKDPKHLFNTDDGMKQGM